MAETAIPGYASGKDEYFSRSKYLLCPFHLFRRLRESLCHDKEAQARIKKMMCAGEIDLVLEQIAMVIKRSKDKKQDTVLKEFYGYIVNNRAGIEMSMVVRADKAIKRCLSDRAQHRQDYSAQV